MSFSEFLHKEQAVFTAWVHKNDLVERIWECDPLLITLDGGRIAFLDRAKIDVTPHEDGTADLVVRNSGLDWEPSLMNAKIECFSSGGMYRGGSRAGLICDGVDPDGAWFCWYLNGAADDFGRRREELNDAID